MYCLTTIPQDSTVFIIFCSIKWVLTLLRAKPIEYYGIVCFRVARNALRISNSANVTRKRAFPLNNYCVVGYTNVSCVAKHMFAVVISTCSCAQYCAVARERVKDPCTGRIKLITYVSLMYTMIHTISDTCSLFTFSFMGHLCISFAY